MKKLTLAVALTGTLALAACGGASTPPAATAQATAPAAATAAPAATQAQAPAATQAAAATQAPVATQAAAGPARKVEVTATNDLYSIKTLEVKPGERIEFVLKNTGDEKHNVVAVGEGVSIVSPDFDAGATVNWIWTAPLRPMAFKFVCSFHPNIPPIAITVK